MDSWLVILPPALAIGLAVVTRHAIGALLVGVWVGWIIATGELAGGTGAAVSQLVAVFGDPGQTSVVLFTLLMGSFLEIVTRCGGIAGFLVWLQRWPWTGTRRGAELLAAGLGLGVFVESTVTCLVVGSVGRPVFDRLGITREKLAYICDSTSAPVCMLIPFNSWGGLILGLLTAQSIPGTQPMGLFLAAVPLNFYALLTVLLVFAVAVTGRDLGPMKGAAARARQQTGAMETPGDNENRFGPASPTNQARLLVLPLAAMVGTVFTSLAVTGRASVREANLDAPRLLDYLNGASGSTAVLWGVLVALILAGILALIAERGQPPRLLDLAFAGAGTMLPIATLLVLAFAIGDVCDILGTGEFLAAQAAPHLTASVAAPVAFLTTGLIAFSIGTSWGTFAIMIPLAVPLALTMTAAGDPVSVPLMVSAVLGGGVFGDHCSPISDTSLISSVAAGCDHIDHVRTQLPYALLAAAGTVVLYLVAGPVMAVAG